MSNELPSFTDMLIDAAAQDPRLSVNVNAALERMRNAYRAEYAALSDALRAAAAQSLPAMNGPVLDVTVALIAGGSLSRVIRQAQDGMGHDIAPPDEF